MICPLERVVPFSLYAALSRSVTLILFLFFHSSFPRRLLLEILRNLYEREKENDFVSSCLNVLFFSDAHIFLSFIDKTIHPY